MRVVSAEGAVGSNAGLLQVRGAGGQYGSVCGLNAAAADLACRQLGFDFGVSASAPCYNYGGRDVCGAVGSAVAVESLACAGAEVNVAQCSWSSPGTRCSDHRSDAVVYCGMDVDGPKERRALALARRRAELGRCGVAGGGAWWALVAGVRPYPGGRGCRLQVHGVCRCGSRAAAGHVEHRSSGVVERAVRWVGIRLGSLPC